MIPLARTEDAVGCGGAVRRQRERDAQAHKRFGNAAGHRCNPAPVARSENQAFINGPHGWPTLVNRWFSQRSSADKREVFV